MKTICVHKVSLAAALLLAGALGASAQKAGYDLLQTQAGGAQIDLSSIPGFSPSKIALKGVPICACTGGTDTIMHRTQDVQANKKAKLEVVALFLKNSGGVTFKGQGVDVYLTINHSNGVIGQGVLPQPDPLPVSTGSLTVNANGTFDSAIHVVADVIVVPAGADVTDPANQLAHKPGPAVELTSSGSAWSSTPPAGYPAACFFPANGFYPGGPVPETAPSHAHPVVPTNGGGTDLKIGKPTNHAINCFWDPSCTFLFTYSDGNIPLPGIAGKAVLRSMTYTAKQGTPVAGLTAYEYFLDLRQAVGTSCVASLSLDFGPVSSLHYSGGPGLEQVYVRPLSGSSALATAVQAGRIITFTFQPSVCAGGAPGKGDTSYFFGLASAKPPRAITAIVTVAGGPPLNVAARVPQP